jgi:glycosyltransferase involved in cell wall biosynthesis
VFNSEARKARALRPFVHGLLRLALGGRGARLIVQNPDDLALFKRTRIMPTNRMHLIKGSGVDLTRFTVAAETRAPGAPLRVLLAARLLWDKGLEEFVEASRILRAQGRNISFLLAGDPDPGNPAAASVEAVLGWTAEGAIEWLGHVHDMPALLRSVDVVVLPSRYGEGLPKVLIEAAGGAHPLIATDAPGCREVVHDGVEGFLVPVRNAPALANAVAKLDDDPALRRRMGEAARARALAEFDHEIVMAKTLEVYTALMGDEPRVAAGESNGGGNTVIVDAQHPRRDTAPSRI